MYLEKECYNLAWLARVHVKYLKCTAAAIWCLVFSPNLHSEKKWSNIQAK